MDSRMYWLFGGLTVFLLIASLIGKVLQSKHGNTEVIVNLNKRINAWWVMIMIIGISFCFGRYGVTLLFFLVSFYALREFITIIETRSSDHNALLVAFYIALPLQYLWVSMQWYGMFSIFIPVYLFLFMPVIAAVKGDTEQFLARTAKIQWAVMITVYCLSSVPALLTLPIQGNHVNNLLLLAWFILVVQLSDVLQYVWGKLFGRRKIVPALSPSKTWEGFVGGVISASVIGMLFSWATPFNLWQALLIGLLICLLGFFGGLVMSAIKRDHHVKDWGNMIEGHGGMLDRLDSVCFAAPIFFHVVRYWWT